MCGIFGVNSKKQNAGEIILQALSRLEYRGYDSAGISLLANQELFTKKVVGKIEKLKQELASEIEFSRWSIGIGHTRWATHGKPSLENAHPIVKKRVAVAHNGIIENHSELRQELQDQGYVFVGNTDTEVIPNLIEYYLDQGANSFQAVQKTLQRLKGAFALLIMFKEDTLITQDNSKLFAAKQGAPLALGLGEEELFVSSDALALAPFASRIVYLEDGDLAEITSSNYKIFSFEGLKLSRQPQAIDEEVIKNDPNNKNGYPHFMLKEINEQPSILKALFERYIKDDGTIDFADIDASIKDIKIIACGTSFYAGLVAKYWLEEIAGISTSVELASEYRYRTVASNPNSLLICISQSGETADTLAALKKAKNEGIRSLGIINVKQSSIANLADKVIYTYAGSEIGVASTKAFTAQLAALALLTLKLAQVNKQLPEQIFKDNCAKLKALPQAISNFLEENKIMGLAQKICNTNFFLFAGRGVSYPISLEGALKTKELSYIPSEGIALGELKHGTLALIDKKCHVIVSIPYDNLFAKAMSNIQEIKARDGIVIAITSSQGAAELKNLCDEVIVIDYPDDDKLITPFISVLPLQLLAYYLALANNRDIDKPRNLSKSVTVE